MATLSKRQPDQHHPSIAFLRSADAVEAEAPELVPIYQMAFAGEPWNEVSKCAAPLGFADACVGRRSADGIGETCEKCGEVLQVPAFSRQELIEDWVDHFRTHQSRLYLERLGDGSCVVAALAWKATPDTLASRCYSNPGEGEMKSWLADELPPTFVWLEDIFAHHTLRSRGNLWNYEAMVKQFLSELDCSVFAFRSLNDALIGKTTALFGSQARLIGKDEVPDHRHVVIVKVSQ